MSKISEASYNEPSSEIDDSIIGIGVYDVLLPCRQYRITYKVAEVGKVSLTTEFLLRLIHAVDGMAELDVARFFEFNASEMGYLLADAANLGYINREHGRIWLTDAGRALFVSSDSPQIYDVETRTMTVGFDLLSFSHEQKTRIAHFESRLPELPIDIAMATHARDFIPDSFRRYFNDVNSRRQSTYATRKSLYSIDEIQAVDRFTTVVPVAIKARLQAPSRGEPDLSKWRTDDQLESRSHITTAVAGFADSLRRDLPVDAPAHYQLLAHLAPVLMQEYTGPSGIAADRFYRDVSSLKGAGFRRNRRTVPLLGPLLNPSNAKLLLEGLSSVGANSPAHCIPRKFYWRAPVTPGWGMSQSFNKLCGEIVDYLGAKAGEEAIAPRSVLLRSTGNRGPERAFSDTRDICGGALPEAVEILLIPGLVSAVLVHLPLLAKSGHAVPIGFVSIDTEVVSRTAELLNEITPIDNPQGAITEEMLDLSI